MVLSVVGMLITVNSAAQPMTQRQTELFAFEESGAPNIGDAKAWEHRTAKGEEVLLAHVIEGFQGMPPLGYCSACNEEDFRAMVRTIAELPVPNLNEAK